MDTQTGFMDTLIIHSNSNGKTSSSPHIPLSERFMAWWHGHNPRIAGFNSKSSVQYKTGQSREDEQIAISEDGIWGPVRRNILEALWGEGFIEPGGEDLAHKTLAPLKVNSTHTVLDLTAGLGGNARLMTKKHNLWMESFESDPELAKTAHRISEKYGQAAQAPVTHIDLQNLNLQESRYDAIYSRERLFTYENKDEILKKCASALKPGGQLLITDFTRTSEETGDGDHGHWTRDPEQEAHFWTKERYLDEFKKSGLPVRSNRDLTKSYVAQIIHGWSRLALALEGGEFSLENTCMLMNEGDIWLKRAEDLISGKLTVTRIFAISNKKKKAR